MIFPLSIRAKRRIYGIGFLVLAPLGFKLWLRFGPELASRSWKPGQDFGGRNEAPEALFPFHAKLLLRSALGYPRQLEGLIPTPAAGSSAALQLEAMGWWSRGGWTPQALAKGHVVGHALALDMGRLLLEDVERPTPARDYNGPEMCQVDYWVRWEAPPELGELLRTHAITGLRPPARVECAPGARMTLQATLVRDGLGWKLDDAQASRRELPGQAGAKTWAWLARIL